MLFKHNLTPQRRHLLQEVRRGIRKQTLRTSDLQLCFLHFREAKINNACWEWGSSIAHVKRDQGDIWKKALNIWATHLYFEHLNPNRPKITALSRDVFDTIIGLIQEADEIQLQRDLEDLYPLGVTKEEILATVNHLYSSVKPRERRSNPKELEGFVHQISRGGHEREDIELVRRLILHCEQKALNIPPVPMKEIVDAIEKAFVTTEPNHKPFTTEEQNYLQLHLLVSLHNLLFDIDPKAFKAITGRKLPADQPMLTVSAQEYMLELAVDFFYLEKGRHLETRDFSCHQNNCYYPLFSTELECSKYLLEGDGNIRSCLFNHPLEVRVHRGRPVIVALERQWARFKPNRPRTAALEDHWR